MAIRSPRRVFFCFSDSRIAARTGMWSRAHSIRRAPRSLSSDIRAPMRPTRLQPSGGLAAVERHLFIVERCMLVASGRMSLKDKLRVGCSGWGYDDWLGGFYPPNTPKSDYLKLYSRVFDVVEVDSSFYRNPGPAVTKEWYRATPSGFRFAMKMPRRITHEKKLKDVAENLGWFYASAKELREKCGPLVAQLPPSIKFDSHWIVMQEFLRALEVDKYPHAIEFRHKSWFRDDVYKLLRDRNVTMVWSENQYLRTPTDVTSDEVYLRMVGDREITEFKEVQKDKSAEMRTWYKELEESSDSVKGALVFFNNHYAGFGPGSVNEFRRLAGMMEYPFPATKAGAGGQKGLADFG